jgi:hypothetical protein
MSGVNCAVSTMGDVACSLLIEDSSAATAATAAANAAAHAAVADNIAAAAAALCPRDVKTLATVRLMIMIAPAALSPCPLGV